MKLSDYILMLEVLKHKHGDLEVEKWEPSRGRHTAPPPQLAHARRYNQRPKGAIDTGAPAAPQFFHKTDNPVQQGDPVIRV